MEILIFVIFFFLFLVPLVLGIVIPIYREHYKSTNGIVNYNSNMGKFVYKVNLSSDDIINILKTQNDIDELTCTFDFEKSIIKFSEYGSNKKYYYQIIECDGFSILRLEQVVGIPNQITYRLNPFMTNKLQAEIIPFSKFGF